MREKEKESKIPLPRLVKTYYLHILRREKNENLETGSITTPEKITC